MNDFRLETERLILRKFEEKDMGTIYLLFGDTEVNLFLPWYPVKDMLETYAFYEKRLKSEKYCFAICLKGKDCPIGYVHVGDDDSHDLGYALFKEFWRQGIVTEACKSVIGLLINEGIPYITATHDKNNPRSGAVMQRLGMRYCYSYQEQWQPKDISVIFRMYQLNLDGQETRTYRKYWDLYDEHFVETDL